MSSEIVGVCIAKNLKGLSEKRIIENLSVPQFDYTQSLEFSSMLNQGNKPGSLTKIISIDCERVLTVKGEQVCRVSVVNYFGNVVLDTLIQPSRVVMDYRTDITGIKPQELQNGEDFLTVTMRLKRMLNDRIVVGHSIENDLKHLNLTDSRCYIRDIALTSAYMNGEGQKQKLKDLAQFYLNARIQEAAHSSVIDARIAIALFRLKEDEIQSESLDKVYEQMYLRDLYLIKQQLSLTSIHNVTAGDKEEDKQPLAESVTPSKWAKKTNRFDDFVTSKKWRYEKHKAEVSPISKENMFYSSYTQKVPHKFSRFNPEGRRLNF